MKKEIDAALNITRIPLGIPTHLYNAIQHSAEIKGITPVAEIRNVLSYIYLGKPDSN